MRSIFSILSAAVFCSAPLSAQDNYSLWPRRPAELEQAQRHLRHREYDQALTLLTPFVHKGGLAGREARQLVGAIRVRRYLSAENPSARRHTVRRGENIERIASANKTSREVIILINGMVDPSALKVGQKLAVIPQRLRAELHPEARELTVWDGRDLIAAYDATPSPDLLSGGNEETKLRDREGELHGARVPRSSALYPSCNRSLRLADGTLITGGSAPLKGRTVQMQQKDANELSLLLGVGARVSIVRDEKSFDPFDTAEPAPATAAQRNN